MSMGQTPWPVPDARRLRERLLFYIQWRKLALDSAEARRWDAGTAVEENDEDISKVCSNTSRIQQNSLRLAMRTLSNCQQNKSGINMRTNE